MSLLRRLLVQPSNRTPAAPAVIPDRLPLDGIYAHYGEVRWPATRWPTFKPCEFACPCCGAFYMHVASINTIQAARGHLGRPMRINSAHRCLIHNAHVGGAPKSQHKKIDFDVSVRGHDRFAVAEALKKAGFTTFGFYRSFIHTDIRSGRRWYAGEKARTLWTS